MKSGVELGIEERKVGLGSVRQSLIKRTILNVHEFNKLMIQIYSHQHYLQI